MSKRTLSSTQLIKKPKGRANKRARTQHVDLSVVRGPAIGEVKTAFVKISSSGITATGVVLDVFGGMTNGTAMRNQFLGRKFQPIGIDMRYTVHMPQGNYTTNGRFNPLCRVVLLQWEDTCVIGTGPSITGIFEDQTTVHSGFELINWENIDVLHDALIPLTTTSSISATSQTGQSVSVHKYIKMNKLKPVLFNDVSASWQKGDIIFTYFSDSNASPVPLLDGWIRVYFTDA